MTKREARRHGSLCTGVYGRGMKAGLLCLKRSKFLVTVNDYWKGRHGAGRCGVHTPRRMRTRSNAI